MGNAPAKGAEVVGSKLKMNREVAINELAKREADEAAEKSKLAEANLKENNSQLGTAARLARWSSMKRAENMSNESLRKAAAAAGGGKRKKIKSKKRTKRNKPKTKRRKNHTKKNRTRKRR